MQYVIVPSIACSTDIPMPVPSRLQSDHFYYTIYVYFLQLQYFQVNVSIICNSPFSPDINLLSIICSYSGLKQNNLANNYSTRKHYNDSLKNTS